MEKKDNSTRTAFFLNLAFTVLELIGGILSGSIAILADSLHDFADSLSLGAGGYFEKKSKKGPTDKYSYGYARFSLLGAMTMPSPCYWVPFISYTNPSTGS